jgi:hypothetical protein
LGLPGLTEPITKSTVSSKRTQHLASGDCFPDEILMDWGHLYVVF